MRTERGYSDRTIMLRMTTMRVFLDHAGLEHPALTALGKIREDAGDTVQALANYQRSLEHDGRQTQLAARVASMQAGAGAGGVSAPTIDMGARVVDRNASQPVR